MATVRPNHDDEVDPDRGADPVDEVGNSYDPKAVENLLSKELLELSLKDRNDIQEEIHGVSCLAPRETPELIRKSLHELLFTLENDVTHPKAAYILSKEIGQRLQKTLYVNAEPFRLRFLRFELFDVKLAARRILMFLEYLVEFFGVFALERPIRLSDLSERDIQYMKRGHMQFMPFRDRSGRRILSIMPNEVYESIPPLTKARMLMYFSWTAGCDVETQRSGLVYVMWLDLSYKITGGIYAIRARPSCLISVRPSVVHFCTPGTAVFRLRLYWFAFRLNRENRNKLKVHLGSAVEVKYQLQSYGIPTDLIPVSWTGKVKRGYLEQWMRTRKAIEEREYDKPNENETDSNQIIECPMVNDVIFKQGTSLLSHPGNAALRSLIEIKNKAQEEEDEGRKIIKMKRRRLVLEIFEEITIRYKGRFLVWNHENGVWNELNDREQILSKIEYLLKEYRKSTRAGQRRKEANRRRVVDDLEKSEPAAGSIEAPHHVYDFPVPFVSSGDSGRNSNSKRKFEDQTPANFDLIMTDCHFCDSSGIPQEPIGSKFNVRIGGKPSTCASDSWFGIDQS